MSTSDETSPLPRLLSGFDRILHGGDYNPDQWQAHPEVLAEDSRLLDLAGCNVVTLGVFAWSRLEPREGEYRFEWLDQAMDAAARRGNRVILATPSGARPPWLARRYPEVRRVTREGLREPHHGRHNHCWTSPVYRQKVALINRKLAERYAGHPALAMWHVSNEYSGACFCDLCQAQFQRFLAKRYGTLERLNDAWWTDFWSYAYADFSEIDARGQIPEGMRLDHLRFVNDQLIDFMLHEMRPLRELSPGVPCTTNFMGTHGANDYLRIARHVDVVADDQYPGFDAADAALWKVGAAVAFKNDLYRAMKPDRPWLLMESTPDVQNWRRPMRLKRPGLHRLEMLQALAHGAEGTCYFQIRKGRGGSEKFHGAVIDHVGHEHTRVFRAVAELGRDYAKLAGTLGARTRAQVAFAYDWEARWGFEISSGPMNDAGQYDRVSHAHYRPFWSRGVSVDVIGSECELEGYRIVVTPQLFLLKPGVAERLRRFVASGGIWVATHYTAYCDEHNRLFLGGLPGAGLGEVLGIWNEEVDALPEGMTRRLLPCEGERWLSAEPRAESVCEIVHLRGATALATYAEDFYAGHPALTENQHDKGRAYYHAARLADADLDAFYARLIGDVGIERALHGELPPGVTARTRGSAELEYLFLMNFNASSAMVDAGSEPLEDLLAKGDEPRHVRGTLELPPFGVRVLARARRPA